MENERLLIDDEILQVIISPSFPTTDAYILPRTFFTDLIKAQDSKTAAARDKWWMEQIEQMLRFDKSQERVLGSISEVVLYELWQQLKLSMKSSAALTDLMGKFPELPLGHEGKFPDLPDKWGEIEGE
jgi:hypothetical protein